MVHIPDAPNSIKSITGLMAQLGLRSNPDRTRRGDPQSLSDIPDETIVLILKYSYSVCDPQHPARWLARFGSLSSKFRRIIISNAVSPVWSQIPVCLCSETHCDHCGREKVPMSFYKGVLRNCSLEKLDVHFASRDSIFSPDSDGFHIGTELGRVSNSTLLELNMHATIVNLVAETSGSASRPSEPSPDPAQRRNDIDALNTTHQVTEFTALHTMFVTTQFLSQDVTWSQYRASDQAYRAAIKYFGQSLLELSLHSNTMLTLDVSDEIIAHQHMYFSEVSLQTLCPYLETLELNGHFPSALLKDGTYFSMTSLQTLRVNNPYFWEWNGTIDPEQEIVPIHFPNLVNFIAEATYEDSEQIIHEILPLCPPSVCHLRLMGNTVQYLNDILCHISIMGPRNLNKLISLEIYDCYFSSLSGDDVLENYSVQNISRSCPELESLVIPIVRLSPMAMNSLMSSFGSFYSGEFLRFQRSHK